MRRSSRTRKRRDDTSEADVVLVKPDQPDNPFTEVQILSHHTDIVRLLIQVGSTRCASAGDDCLVIVWDIEVGRRLHVLAGHRRPVTSMCLMEATITISTDHQGEPPILLTGASDKLVCAWNVDAGCCLFTTTDHDGPIRCLLTLPEYDVFCAGGEKLCLWDRDGRLLSKYSRHEEEDIQGMVVMPTDLLVAIVDRQLVVYSAHVEGPEGGEKWSVQLQRKLPAHREAIRSLVQVNDGCFASGSLDGTVVLWTVPALTPSRYFNALRDYEGENKMYPYSIQHITVAEERYLFAAVGSGFCVYDAISGRLLAKKLNAHYSKILHLQFVYDGTFLATGSEDGSIRLWGPSVRAATTPKEVDNCHTPVVQEDRTVVEKFMGMSKNQLKALQAAEPMEPSLLGECLAHSGAVQLYFNRGFSFPLTLVVKLADSGAQMCLDYESEGFVSCGVDGLLILWKDGFRQDWKRSDIIRDLLLGSAMAGIV